MVKTAAIIKTSFKKVLLVGSAAAVLIVPLLMTKPAYAAALTSQPVYVRAGSDRTLLVDKTSDHSTFLHQAPGTYHEYSSGSEGDVSSAGLYFWVNSGCKLYLKNWYKSSTYTASGHGYWKQWDSNGWKITVETYC